MKLNIHNPRQGMLIRLLVNRYYYIPAFVSLAALSCLVVGFEYRGDESLYLPAILPLVLIALFLLEKKYYTAKIDFFEPDIIFIALFVLFHFSYIWLYLLGLSDYDNEVFYDENQIVKALYFCTFSMLLFIIGYGKPIGYPRRIAKFSANHFMRFIYSTSKYLMIIILFMFWLPLISAGSIIFHDYTALINIAKYTDLGKVFFAGQYLAIPVFAMYCFSRSFCVDKKKQYYDLMVVIYCLSYLVVGDRGGFLYHSIIPIICFNLYEKKINLKILLPVIIALLIVSSFISSSRVSSIFNPFRMYNNYYQTTQKNPVIKGINEFGITLKTVVIAMHYVPNRQQFWYGSSYLHSLSLVIPNIGEARQYSRSAGAWLTETAFESLDQTHGRGGSIALESYVNFGVLGVFLFAIYGVVLKSFYARFLRHQTVLYAVLYFASISSFCIWIRNSSDYFPRTIMWSIFTIFILKISYPKKYHSQRIFKRK